MCWSNLLTLVVIPVEAFRTDGFLNNSHKFLVVSEASLGIFDICGDVLGISANAAGRVAKGSSIGMTVRIGEDLILIKLFSPRGSVLKNME